MHSVRLREMQLLSFDGRKPHRPLATKRKERKTFAKFRLYFFWCIGCLVCFIVRQDSRMLTRNLFKSKRLVAPAQGNIHEFDMKGLEESGRARLAWLFASEPNGCKFGDTSDDFPPFRLPQDALFVSSLCKTSYMYKSARKSDE